MLIYHTWIQAKLAIDNSGVVDWDWGTTDYINDEDLLHDLVRYAYCTSGEHESMASLLSGFIETVLKQDPSEYDLPAIVRREAADEAHDALMELRHEGEPGDRVEAPCPVCHGTAIDGSGERCIECVGGTRPAEIARCWDCDGDGYHILWRTDRMRQTRECESCDGSGNVVVYDDWTLWRVEEDTPTGVVVHTVYEETGALDELLARIDKRRCVIERA